MSPADDPLQRRKTQAIAAVFGIHLVFGAVLVMLHPDLASNQEAMQQAMLAVRSSGISYLYQIAVLVACFVWLGCDSRQLDIRRPWWLNLGVIFLTSVFVPYYLYKTRPPGQRGAAIMAFLGVLFGSFIAMSAGMFLALAVHGGAPSAGTGI